MSILSNIVRGGQLSLHALGMLKQVLYALMICILCIGLVIFTYDIYHKLNQEQVHGFIDYHIAKYYKEITHQDKLILVNVNHIKKQYKVSSVLNSSYFIIHKQRVHKEILTSSIFASKISFSILLVLLVVFIIKGLQKTGERFQRGAQIYKISYVRKLIKKFNKQNKYKAYNIAGMPYPAYGEMQHSLIIGANGTGKTALISDIVEQIRIRGDKAIIYDKKCDYLQWFYDTKLDFILNPFDQRGQDWNLLNEITHIGHIKSIAQAFIPKKSFYAEGNEIWDEAARITLSAILEKFMNEQKHYTNQAIIQAILQQDLKTVTKLVKNTYAQHTLSLDSPKTASSVLFVLASHLNSLRLINGNKETSFSIKQWLENKNRNSILFITSQENFTSELIPLQAVWFEIIINHLLSGPQNNQQKTWIILDELPTIQKIPSLAKGLAVSRSYGGCFVLGMQNIAQMKEIYGHNMTQDISSECNTRCMFKTNDPDTAKWMSANIGETEIKEFKEGLSYGASTMKDGVNVNSYNTLKSLLIASEFQHLKRLHLFLKMPDFPIVNTGIKYKIRNKKNLGFITNNYTILQKKKLNKINIGQYNI